MLALVLQTHGLVGTPSTTESSKEREKLSSENSKSEQDEEQAEDDAVFRAYWAEQVVPDFRRPYLHRLLNDLCKRCRQANFLPLGGIMKAISGNAYGGDFSAFETAVT